MQPNPTYEGNQEIPWIQFFMREASPGGGQEARRSPNMAAQGQTKMKKNIPGGRRMARVVVVSIHITWAPPHPGFFNCYFHLPTLVEMMFFFCSIFLPSKNGDNLKDWVELVFFCHFFRWERFFLKIFPPGIQKKKPHLKVGLTLKREIVW